MKNKKAFIFIDGSNFYFKLKELNSHFDSKFKLLDFEFRKFGEWLVRNNKLVEIRYYIGAVKRKRNNKKSERMYANQQKLIGKLQQQNIAIALGQIIQHPELKIISVKSA